MMDEFESSNINISRHRVFCIFHILSLSHTHMHAGMSEAVPSRFGIETSERKVKRIC